MGKGQDSKKAVKKEAAKATKEKKAEKRARSYQAWGRHPASGDVG